jgi:YbbR domain-containing protein
MKKIVITLWRLLTVNLSWKLAALFMSAALWASINGSEPNADRYLRVGVSPFGLPKRLVIANRYPATAEVQIRGPRSLLRTVNEDTQRVALDLRGARAGTKTITLHADMLNLPRRVRVVRINPGRVNLRVERLSRKDVPVKVVLVPAERNGYTISDVTATPAAVEVAGPAGRVERLRAVETESVSTLDVKGHVEREVGIAEGGEWLSFSPDTIRVGFVVHEIEATRTFTGLPVVVRGARGGATLTPATIALTVRGPQRHLADLTLDEGAAYVDATDLAAGEHVLAVQVTLPGGFHAHGVAPPALQLTLEEETGPVGEP